MQKVTHYFCYLKYLNKKFGYMQCEGLRAFVNIKILQIILQNICIGQWFAMIWVFKQFKFGDWDVKLINIFSFFIKLQVNHFLKQLFLNYKIQMRWLHIPQTLPQKTTFFFSLVKIHFNVLSRIFMTYLLRINTV